MGSVVGLINLISREVSSINVRGELGLEGGTDTAKSIKFDTTEELVVFDLICTSTAKTVLGVADKAIAQLARRIIRGSWSLPSDQILCLGTQLNVIREVEGLAPVDDLAISVMCILSTERRPANLTFEHDSTQAPPVTVLAVTMTTEDLRSNVVWSSNSGVGHKATRLSPVVDNTSVANSEIDLVKIDRVAITRPVGLPLEQVLIV